MDQLLIALGWTGIIAPLALAAVGSAMAASIAGQAACGALLEVESGYGRYVGLCAMPSSQTIYGIVVMFSLERAVTLETAPGLFGIGVLTGIALYASAVWQGRVLAAAIAAAKSKPEIFGISLAPAAIVEGFAVFAFVFALVVAGGVPAGT
ncbi:MAG: ATP synthase subunit C [Acidobacteriota bacterium]